MISSYLYVNCISASCWFAWLNYWGSETSFDFCLLWLVEKIEILWCMSCKVSPLRSCKFYAIWEEGRFCGRYKSRCIKRVECSRSEEVGFWCYSLHVNLSLDPNPKIPPLECPIKPSPPCPHPCLVFCLRSPSALLGQINGFLSLTKRRPISCVPLLVPAAAPSLDRMNSVATWFYRTELQYLHSRKYYRLE